MGLIKLYSEEKEAKSVKQKIIDELKELDAQIPRVLEDIIEQSGYSLHPSKFAVLEKKKELRKQLQGLED